MLKKRIIATVVVKNGIVVQSINFRRFLPVGKPSIAVEFLDRWGIDEIVIIDISATESDTGPNYEMVKEVAMKCRVPLTVGGGIKNIEQIRLLMNSGADRVSLNHQARTSPALITEAARIFGSQSIIVSVDVSKQNGKYTLYNYLTKESTDIPIDVFARTCEELGAGQLLVNNVDRDGTYLGYDLDLINIVCESIRIPVIASGGAKTARDFLHVLQNTKAAAASAANMFHFTEHSVITTKAIINADLDIRLDTHANYSSTLFDENCRLIKHHDDYLSDLLYLRIEKEII